MSPIRAKDVHFSANDQANQTMILDLDSGSANERAPANSDEATLVLDLSATQVRGLLEEEDSKS